MKRLIFSFSSNVKQKRIIAATNAAAKYKKANHIRLNLGNGKAMLSLTKHVIDAWHYAISCKRISHVFVGSSGICEKTL